MKVTRSSEKLKVSNIAGVILKPESPEIKKEFLEIKKCLEFHNIEVFLEKCSAKMIGEEGFSLDELCEKVDFLVSVGGDGTLLSVVRKSFNFNIPVLGIHLGTLGFLTDIIYEEFPTFLNDFKSDNYRIDNRMLVECCVNDKCFVAFNDIVISRKTVSSMITIKAKIDGSSLIHIMEME